MPNPTTERIDEKLTREEVERIDELAKKATSGDWYENDCNTFDRKDYAAISAPTWGVFVEVCIPESPEMQPEFSAEGRANIDFIIALRNAWPRIRAALLGLESERVAALPVSGQGEGVVVPRELLTLWHTVMLQQERTEHVQTCCDEMRDFLAPSAREQQRGETDR